MSEHENIGGPLVLNEINFEQVLKESRLPLLFEFWAPWCHHCMALSPVIEQVAAEMAGEIIVGQINCDLNRDLRKRYGVQAIPTLFLARNGEVVGTILNPKDKNTLCSWIRGLIG